MSRASWNVVPITEIVAPTVAWVLSISKSAWAPRGWGDGACPVVGCLVRSSRLSVRSAPISLWFVAAVHDNISRMLVKTALMRWPRSWRKRRCATLCWTWSRVRVSAVDVHTERAHSRRCSAADF